MKSIDSESGRWQGKAGLPESSSFELEEGTPTLTFASAEMTLALPYHFLRTMRLEDGARNVVLAYDCDGMTVTVSGTNLRPLWRALQLYTVREIRAEAGDTASRLGEQSAACVVSAITIEQFEEEIGDE